MMLSRGFRLEEQLGSGLDGVCYRGVDGDGRLVCIKLADRDDSQARVALERERAAGSLLRHDAIPRSIAFGVWDAKRLALVREYVAGTRLDLALAAARAEERAGIVGRLAATLAELHAVGWVHGDLKPAHVLLEEGSGEPRFIDLGFSAFSGDAPARGVGTAPFAAPELVSGEPVSAAADVYALGVSVMVSLLGLEAFRVGDHEALDELLPAAVASAVRAAVQARAELRPDADTLRRASGIEAGALARRTPVDGPWREHDARRVIAVPAGSQRLSASMDRAARAGFTTILLRADHDDGWLARLAELVDVDLHAATSTEGRVAALCDALARASAERPLCIVLETAEVPLSRAVSVFADSARGEVALAATSTLGGRWALVHRDPTLPRESVDGSSLRRIVELRGIGRAVADSVLDEVAAAFPEDVDAAEDALTAIAGGVAKERAMHEARRRSSAAPVLSSGERSIVDALVLTGAGLTREALAAATGFPAASLDDLLERLVARQLLRRTETLRGSTWGLAHPRLLERGPADSAIARRLAAWFDGQGDVESACLCELRTGVADRACQVLLAKARVATRPADARRALAPLVAHLRAHPTPTALDVLRYASEVDERCGELADVIATEDVLARVGGSDDATRCRALKAAITQGAYDRALAIAARAMTEAQSASMLLLRARLALHRGELDAAARLAAEATGRPDARIARAELLHLRGLVDFYRGRAKDAERRLRRASRLVDVTADPAAAASIATSRGLVAHKTGRLRRALASYRRAYRLSRVAGDVTRLPARLLNLGTAAQDAGRLAAAQRYYQEAATLAARVGSDRDRVRVGFNVANLALQLGALDSAARWLKLTTPLAAERGMRVEVARLTLLDAELGLANESVTHVRGALARYAEFRGERDAQMTRHAALVHARLALLEGDVLHARLAANDLDLADAEAALVAARIELADRGAAPGKATELASRASGGSPLLAWQTALLQAELAERAGDELALDDAVAAARVAWKSALAALPPEHAGNYQRVPANARQLARLSSLWAKARGSGASSMLERVLRINRKLNECVDLDELLGAILEEVSALTASERSLALVKRESGVAVLAQRAIASGTDADFSRGIAEQVMASGRSVVTSDAMADERFMEQRSVRDLRMRSIACVPLLIDGVPRGAIYLDHRARTDVFSIDALSVLNAFAEQAALALKSAELRLALLAERRELELARSNLASENEALHSSLSRTSEELARAKLHLATSDDEALRAKFSQIVARSRGMLDVLDKVQRFASVPLPIFVHGESGAGKELVARALHTHSPRAAGPFVALNCAAIPNELLESELFGVRRGAFTGAVNDRQGLFRVADGGTLFLDEVGDMGAPMQTKLLRVLEEGTFRAVGATEEQRTDVRIVCASHKSLTALVEAGRFREDLYYRLAGALIEIPPLRERVDDIPELTRVLLAHAAKEFGIAVPKVKRDVLDALQSYAWPGNVRELDNELRRALALADDELRVGHFSKSVRSASRGVAMSAAKSKRYRDAVASFEKSFLAEALAANDNDPSRAARAIGISRSGIYAKLKQHRLVNDR